MSSLGEGVRRHKVNDLDTGSLVKGIQQTQIFTNKENLNTLPAPRCSDLLTWFGHFSLTRQDQNL